MTEYILLEIGSLGAKKVLEQDASASYVTSKTSRALMTTGIAMNDRTPRDSTRGCLPSIIKRTGMRTIAGGGEHQTAR